MTKAKGRKVKGKSTALRTALRTPAKTLIAERRAKPDKYPLALAEKRLWRLYEYVAKRGGKVPK